MTRPGRLRGWLPWALAMAVLLGALVAVSATVASASASGDDSGVFGLEALVDAGLKVDDAVAAGEVDRLVRAGLVHTGWKHLAINCFGLALIGFLYWRMLGTEQRSYLAAATMLAIALLASSAGFVASYLLRMGPSCGASAAVYGLLGAIVGRVWMGRRALPPSYRLALPLMLTLVSLASVLVLLPNRGIDHAAHLSGWALGIALGVLGQLRFGRQVLTSVASVVLVVAYV